MIGCQLVENSFEPHTQIFGGLSEGRRNEKCSKAVLFETGKLLGSAWVSFAITQRIGFTLDDTSVLGLDTDPPLKCPNAGTG